MLCTSTGVLLLTAVTLYHSIETSTATKTVPHICSSTTHPTGLQDEHSKHSGRQAAINPNNKQQNGTMQHNRSSMRQDQDVQQKQVFESGTEHIYIPVTLGCHVSRALSFSGVILHDVLMQQLHTEWQTDKRGLKNDFHARDCQPYVMKCLWHIARVWLNRRSLIQWTCQIIENKGI